MTTGHALWDELAAGYAVNALEPEDEHAFLDHLRGCGTCRDTLAELAAVTGDLAFAAEPVAPPAALGRRILDAAAAERPAVFGKAPPVALARSGRSPRRGRMPSLRAASLVTAAAVVAVFGLGVWSLVLRGDARAQRLAIERRDRAITCLAAPDAPTVVMAASTGGRATSCMSGGRAYLVVDRLDPNAADSVYVLWWVDRAEVPHAVERFDVRDGDGPAVYELPLSAAPADVTAMAVSLEPGRGLPARPTRVVAQGAAASG